MVYALASLGLENEDVRILWPVERQHYILIKHVANRVSVQVQMQAHFRQSSQCGRPNRGVQQSQRGPGLLRKISASRARC